MSLQSFVFLKHCNIPSLQAWSAAIHREGFALQLPALMPVTTPQRVLIHGSFEGLASCFDYFCYPYNAADWPIDNNIKPNDEIDTIVVFNTYANAQEIVGMLVSAAVLTKISHGLFFSECFDDAFVGPEDIIGWLEERMPNIRQQFNGPSKLRE